MKKRQRISNRDSAGFAVGRFRPAFLRLIVKIIFIYCLITMPFISEAAESTCGNGVVDPGEDCDYGMKSASECCSKTCKFLPNLRQTCQDGSGVCQNGACISRESQCSRWDTNILATGNSQFEGPFRPCAPGQNSRAVLTEQKCTLSCAGSPTAGSQWQCLDFSQFSNIDSQVSDGLLCGSMGDGERIGICMGGQCDREACRHARCRGRGDCVRGPSGDTKDVQCRCDNPYSGSVCQLAPSCDKQLDACGVCAGDNSTCSLDVRPSPGVQIAAFLSSPLFLTVIVPILSTIVFISLVILAIYFYYHRRNNQSVHPSLMGTGSGGWIPKQGPPQRFGISVRWEEYRCIQDYEPRMPDELALMAGDILFKLFEYDDGWAKGYNTRTQQEGVYPVSFTEVSTGDSSVMSPEPVSSPGGNTEATKVNANNNRSSTEPEQKSQVMTENKMDENERDSTADQEVRGPFTNFSSL